MRVGVLLVVVGLVGACGGTPSDLCGRLQRTQRSLDSQRCPSADELRTNCPKYCEPGGTNCACQIEPPPCLTFSNGPCITVSCDAVVCS